MLDCFLLKSAICSCNGLNIVVNQNIVKHHILIPCLLKKELIKTTVIAKLYNHVYCLNKFLNSVNFGVINNKSTNYNNAMFWPAVV